MRFVPIGKLRCFEVMSPDYNSASIYSPPEWGRDYVRVFAKNKRRAKSVAVKHWRRLSKKYGRFYVTYYSDENPFSRLTVSETTIKGVCL